MFVAVIVLLPACESVKEGIRDADQALKGVFGEEHDPAAEAQAPVVPAEPIFRRASSIS